MNPRELRIGNWYDHNGDYRQVTPNTIEEVWEAERVWCRPIPITEEWLLKFGFKQWGSYKHLWKLKGVHGFTITTVRGAFDLNEYCFYRVNSIEYVHQLQNLYFALTGNELELQ